LPSYAVRLRTLLIGSPAAFSPMLRSPHISSLSLLATACFLALSLGACNRGAGEGEPGISAAGESTPAEAAAETNAPLERVRTMPVERNTIELALDAVANVESLDVVDVMAERAEPVIEILVEEGDQVKKGQVIARLRDRVASLAVRDAEVRVREAENEYKRATRDNDRNKQLAVRPDGTSLLSERDLENSEQAMLAAGTALESAQVALDQARLDFDRCTLLAPIDGTVTARDISLGDQTVVGQRAFQVADLARPRVIFYRPQGEIGQLKIGQLLVANSAALPPGGIKGQIERIAPVVDAQSGTVKVTAILNPSAEMTLPTGLLVRLRLVLDSHPDAILIPKRGVIYDDDRMLIFAVRDGKAVQVVLQPGFENPTHIEHLGDEITEADFIVTVGQDRLDDGEAVEVLAE
jgi:membrane fusion protein, multidrug efflux system